MGHQPQGLQMIEREAHGIADWCLGCTTWMSPPTMSLARLAAVSLRGIALGNDLAVAQNGCIVAEALHLLKPVAEYRVPHSLRWPVAAG